MGYVQRPREKRSRAAQKGRIAIDMNSSTPEKGVKEKAARDTSPTAPTWWPSTRTPTAATTQSRRGPTDTQHCWNANQADQQGNSRADREVIGYALVSLSSFAAAAASTGWVNHVASHITSSHIQRTALVAGAYLATYGVLFVLKAF